VFINFLKLRSSSTTKRDSWSVSIA